MALILRGKWLIELEDGPHIVRAEYDFWSVLKVYFDNKMICDKFFFNNATFRFINADKHQFTLKEKGIFNREFILIVDGVEYLALDEIVTAHEQPLKVVKQPPAQIIREENIQETVQIVDIEEFPLDNSAGTDALTVEHEVSKTVSNELSITTSTTVSGTLEADLLTILKLEVSASLSKQLGQNIGETITRRQTLHFTVQPHYSVTYAVVWKRKTRTADCLVFVNSKLDRISYKVNYDLSYEVKSRGN